MKRAFLFGLGSFLIVLAIGMLWDAVTRISFLAGVVGLVCGPLSIAAIRAANGASRDSRFMVRLAAWLGGFFALDAAILLVFALFSLAGYPV